MSGLNNWDRRSVLILAATWLFNSTVGSLLAEETSASSGAAVPAREQSRRYSVHASIMVGSIPIFTKARVGGALLSVEVSGTPQCGAVALQFGAGTWPDRLKGFNRFGITQEIVRTEQGRLTQSSYCSFMTTSREANLSQAEQSFRSSIDSMPLTVGYGQSTADGCTDSIDHESVPVTFSWSDCPKLMDELRGRKPAASPRSAQPSQRSVLPTFLYAVRRAILSGLPRTSVIYTHTGEIYTLTTDRHAVSGSAEAVITGRISHEASRRETDFRLWMPAGSDEELPVRIEFRAKSYLKLMLELDERQTLPVFNPILKETSS